MNEREREESGGSLGCATGKADREACGARARGIVGFWAGGTSQEEKLLGGSLKYLGLVAWLGRGHI